MQLAYDQLGSIARQIGTIDFMHQMHRHITRQIRVDHLALEYLDGNQQLIPLDRASISSMPIKELGTAYRENQLYKVDPMRHIAKRGKALGDDLRVMINHREDMDSPHQGELFKTYGIQQRLVIGLRAGNGWLCQKMIRCEHFGLASDAEIGRLEKLARLVLELSIPHTRLLLCDRASETWFKQILQSERVVGLIFPELSPRERQCFGLIISGLSNEAAAKKLGVSTNTFITLRSRGYKKVGVSSVEQLHRAVEQHIGL